MPGTVLGAELVTTVNKTISVSYGTQRIREMQYTYKVISDSDTVKKIKWRGGEPL